MKPERCPSPKPRLRKATLELVKAPHYCGWHSIIAGRDEHAYLAVPRTPGFTMLWILVLACRRIELKVLGYVWPVRSTVGYPLSRERVMLESSLAKKLLRETCAVLQWTGLHLG